MCGSERTDLAQIAGTADVELKKAGAIFYDSEIICMIPMQNEVRHQDLFYCKGWEDHQGMGISVVCAYDFVAGAYHVYLQDNLDAFRKLIESRNIIIGFANYRFDDKLMAANNIIIPRSKSYDMWMQIADTQPPGQRAGFALNPMLAANNLESKSGDGGNAPRLAQKAKWGELIDYCLTDVRLSVQLLRLLCNDMMVNPKNGGYLTVKKPWEIVKVEPGDNLF